MKTIISTVLHALGFRRLVPVTLATDNGSAHHLILGDTSLGTADLGNRGYYAQG